MERKDMTPLVFALVASLEVSGADIAHAGPLPDPALGKPKPPAPEAAAPKDERVRSGNVHLAQWTNWLNCFNGGWRNC